MLLLDIIATDLVVSLILISTNTITLCMYLNQIIILEYNWYVLDLVIVKGRMLIQNNVFYHSIVKV